MSPLTLLAQATATYSAGLDTSNPVVFLGLLIGALVTLATLVDKVDAFAQRRRRVPPLDRELAGFATKADLDGVDNRLSAEIADMRKHVSASHNAIYKRIEDESRLTRVDVAELGKTIDAEFRTLYRALGKAEGKLETAD